MRKNYKINTEQGIKKITLLSSTIIILTIATIIGSLLIKTQYDTFKNYINNYETTLINREMFNIKSSVENIKNDINFFESSILENKKHRIKNQSIIAYNLAFSLYKKTPFLEKNEQIEFIKSSINQMSQDEYDINYFILNTQGTLILNSQNIQDENKNYYDFKDINSFEFIKGMINNNIDEQNYLEYTWYKPNSTITSKKITYSKHLKELNLIIGSGSFLDTNKNKLNKMILNKIYKQQFNTDTYIIISKLKSLNNIQKNSSLLLEKNIISSYLDFNAINKLMQQTNYKGNSYQFYDDKNKLIYGTFIPHLRYFISVGVNLSNIQKIVKKERMISLNNMYSKIISVVIIISILTIIFFILSLLFTKKITLIFENYKKDVILNEEKYHLLFNHSNDAFLISLVKNRKMHIINFNKTALKVTFYEEKELLEKDFFALFYDLTYENLLKEEGIFKTVKMKTKNNELKTIELNAIIYSNGKQQLLFASLRDITERTLLKEEKNKQEKILIQKSKMAAMGEMIGNIAHQWRQPLSQVSGLFFDLESAYNYKELNKKYLESTVNEANDLIEYMSKTIDDFKNFFNPNAKKEKFLVQNAIIDSSKIIKSTLDYYKIHLEIKIDNNFEIYAYKNEYSQAILNIVSNAKDVLLERKIKDPKIVIFSHNNSIQIQDNAGGIPDNIIKKIFDPYFTTKFEYGTGIGLYMTKLIIEDKMNGHISVKNTKKGALFIIEI